MACLIRDIQNMNLPEEVSCNNCQEIFDYKSNIVQLKKGQLTDVGSECPHCNRFCHSYYLDKDLIKRQKSLKKFRNNPKLFKPKQERYIKRFKALQEKVEKLADIIH